MVAYFKTYINKMNKQVLFLGACLSGVLLLSSCSATIQSEAALAASMQNTLSSGEVTIEHNNIDLGDIPIMEGTVDATFIFTNTGPEALALFKGETSCMCTNAVVTSDNGIVSPTLVMSGHGSIGGVSVDQVLQPGESATLTATFDPLAHGPDALGTIKRDVTIKTNSKATPTVSFSFLGNVVKALDNTMKSETISQTNTTEPFTFSESTHDFGLIKQSGGKVKHDFAFTYNGQTPITITGVPTSCACTSASVNVTTLQPGDQGILAVTFNPNLHEEPKGRFYKSVSLLTEPNLTSIPEVKIWTEIDLDLGESAYELKDSHDEDSEDKHAATYTSITPQKFIEMNQKKDFLLIDTHIPEQERIPGTDLFIPYTDIATHSKLPTDKNAKIVLYCRSGGMSRAAAYQLVEQGYTNVFDLSGGKNEYDKLLLPSK